MTNEEQPSATYEGMGMYATCPCCGEDLWVFLPAAGGIKVTPVKDILPESDDDEE